MIKILQGSIISLSLLCGSILYATGTTRALTIDPTSDTSRFDIISTEIDIDVIDNVAHVIIQKKLLNRATYDQNYVFTQSLPPTATPKHLYVDYLGTDFEIIEPEQWFSKNWNQLAKDKNHQQISYIIPQRKILTSPPQFIAAEAEMTFKLLYEIPVTSAQSVEFIEIDTTQMPNPKRLDVRFRINDSTPAHFWHNLPLDGFVEKNTDSLAYWYWSEKFWTQSPMRLYWSNTDNFSFEQQLPNQKILAHVVPRPQKPSFKKIDIIIDSSGSMSGNTWYLVQDLVDWLLGFFGEATSIQIKTISALTAREFTNGFEPNTRDLKKKIRSDLPLSVPLGKSAPNNFIVETGEADLIILITDETNDIAIDTDTPIAVLSFADNQNIAETMMFKSGFFLKLFSVTTDIIQTAEITKKLNQINASITNNKNGFLPKKIAQFSDQSLSFFAKRDFTEPIPPSEKKSNTNAFQFLGQSWAQAKMAVILDQIHTNDNATENQVNDLLYLGRNYGVNTSWFNAETQQKELTKILNQPSNRAQIPYKNHFLRQPNLFIPGDQTKFWNTMPMNFYPDPEHKGDQILRSIDFYDKASPDNLVKIAPFSDAQKKLLEGFSDIFAPIFSLHDQVDFCLEWKCFSVRKGFRSAPLPSDRAFVYDFPAAHWSKDYLVRLVNQTVIKTDKNGNLDPQKIMTRGEVANIIARQFNELSVNKEVELADEDTPLFMDIGVDAPYYEATKFLADQNIMKGFIDGDFKPFERITRAQALKTVMAANNLNPETNFDWSAAPVFGDANGWERPWVEAAFAAQKINGEIIGSHRYFWSTRSIKLGEVAKLIVEFADN